MTIQSEIQALKCADCARSDSAVSDLQPDSLLPIPADALSGWRDGQARARAGVDAPQAAAQRHARLRGRVRRDAARLEDVWESAVAQAAEPMQKSLVVIYLNGGNDGLNCFVPDERRGVRRVPGRSAPNIARVLGPGTARGKVGTTVMRGTGGALGFANKLVSGAGADQQRRHRRASTRSTATARGGAGSDLAVIPGGRLQPAQPLALREPRLLVRRRALAAADRLARPLARRLRLAVEPAAGRLARLEPVASRSAPRRRPCARSRACRASASTCPASTGDVNSEVGKLADRADRRGQRRARAARAACTGLTVDVANRLDERSPAARPAPGYPPNSGLSQQLQLGGHAALGRPRHARRHDRLGQLRHARRPARRAGSAAHDALARAGRVQGRPGRRAASSRTWSRWSSPSSAAASRSPTRAAPTTARAAR